jgi:Skp family chaperone for outer membrane proteins
MKGILHVVAALLLLNVAALTLWSRAAPPPPAARPTRVAVFNLTRVVKNYEKFKTYQIELAGKVDPFQKRDTEKKKRAEKLAEEAKDVNLTPDQRAKLEKSLTKLQREIEDNKAEAQAVLVKAQERQLVSLYTEVEAVARRLAKQRGYDLVMHFNDAEDEAERRSPANVARKMQAGALMPIHAGPGVDLSEAILEELHKDMKRESL